MKQLLLMTWMLLVTAGSYAQGPNNSGDYYKNADGKTGAELKTALCGIIYNRSERSYSDLWTDFQTTDKRADGSVWDMYSGVSHFTFVVDQDPGSGGTTEGDKYNREHSFPNSWFGGNKNTPMYTDLHHMYPTDKLVNNKRGNNPFGETNGESYKSANDFSKLGKCKTEGYTGTVFEPNDEYKGDFARTYFYMVTCYEEQIPTWYTSYSSQEGMTATLDGNTYPGLSSWQLAMLMRWAKIDPVSEKEVNRNNAVYGIQKNRNPFIDYPGLEDYIWGDKKTVRFNYSDYATSLDDMIIQNGETDGEQPEAIYSPDGKRRTEMRNGLNIIRLKNGKVIKLVKGLQTFAN